VSTNEEYLDDNIYKVTNAKVAKTKNGYDIFEFTLNGSINASMLFPLRKIDKSSCKVYQLYLNTGDLSSLHGKLIHARLTKNKFGFNIFRIDNIDVSGHFFDILKKNSDKHYFWLPYPYYDFLKNYTKRPIDNDGHIQLKPPFDSFFVRKGRLIFKKNTMQNTLNFENSALIFNKFYSGKEKNESLDYFRHTRYKLISDVEIISETERSSDRLKGFRINKTILLGYGDNLRSEHIQFLKTLGKY